MTIGDVEIFRRIKQQLSKEGRIAYHEQKRWEAKGGERAIAAMQARHRAFKDALKIVTKEFK